jgi:alpha-L-rhamnosidase
LENNEDGTVTVNFEVPFNCRAKVKLPDYEGDIVWIEAGCYEITYKPFTDYRKMFNMNSRLEELGKNQEAMKILSEELPMVAGMIAGGDAENLSISLNELQFMFFLGLNPEVVGKAAKRLFEINAF